MHERITFIIITHNRKAYLQRCVDSIYNTQKQPFEVIVVDDASSDDTSPFIQQHYPDIKLTTLTENKGAAIARNIAMKQVETEFICSLDDDAAFHEGDVHKLLPYFDDSSLGFVNFKFIDDRQYKPIISLIPRRDRTKVALDKDMDVALITAGGHLTKTTTMKTLKYYWKEMSPLALEDQELAWRAVDNGFRIMWTPAITCIHPLARKAKVHPKRIQYNMRNKTLAYIRNMPWRYVCVGLFLWYGFFFVASLKARTLKPFFAGLYQGWRDASKAFALRKPLNKKAIAYIQKHKGITWY